MNEFPAVLVINCGSSSVKFSVLNANDCEVLASDITDSINSEGAFLFINGGGPAPLAHRSYEGVLEVTAFELEKRNLNDSMALTGHRIAHGGSIFAESTVIAGGAIDNIHRISSLVSLYNYADLSGTELARQLFPDVTQVAVFGTNFHQTMTPEAYLYDLPQKYHKGLGVHRYDFHDTSHRYASQCAYSLLSLAEDDSGLIMAHLDNGASIYAVRNSRSVDISVGIIPLKGLMMDTHSGDVDFGTISWVADQTNRNLGDLERMVNKESELLGISSLSSDLCVLEKAWHEGHERMQLAIKTSVHRITRHIAGHVASLHHLDGVISTGGVGKNPSLIHRPIMEHLTILSVETDTEMNNRSNPFGERIVSSENARIIYAVIPTSEGGVIALDATHLSKVNAPAEFT